MRAAFALLLLLGPALADEPRAPKMPKPEREPHVSAFGARDKTCLEWTNACQVCTRDAATAQPNCSTPGVACTPTRATCSRR